MLAATPSRAPAGAELQRELLCHPPLHALGRHRDHIGGERIRGRIRQQAGQRADQSIGTLGAVDRQHLCVQPVIPTDRSFPKDLPSIANCASTGSNQCEAIRDWLHCGGGSVAGVRDITTVAGRCSAARSTYSRGDHRVSNRPKILHSSRALCARLARVLSHPTSLGESWPLTRTERRAAISPLPRPQSRRRSARRRRRRSARVGTWPSQTTPRP